MKVILGVSSSIAIYKACDLARSLKREGADVTVVMTANATRLIDPRLFDAVTENATITDLFNRENAFGHLTAARDAACFAVAPATANVIGKLAAGVADDALTTVALAVTCPRLVAPAMNPAMWAKKEVQDNIARLRELGYVVIPPAEGTVACGDVGTGRLADINVVLEYILSNILIMQVLLGKQIVVTAGPTTEPLDAARVLTNPSSGLMGYEIARAAGRRGASVTLITGARDVPAFGPNVTVIRVKTAEDMFKATEKAFRDTDALIMAAAVADYTPASGIAGKHKKSGEKDVVTLVPTTDVVGELAAGKGRKIVVGFAAETDNLLENAKAKLLSKNLDMVIGNIIASEGVGFGAAYADAVIVTKDSERHLGKVTKEELAAVVVADVAGALGGPKLAQESA